MIADLPPVSGDPDRLQQVVWNLLSNAVKFTPRGGHVWLSPRARRQRRRIVVKDDGQGIDPKFLPHFFERFRQADSRFSREHGGLGLGLAIVRDLVELHGGSVSASSGGPGTGATFRVRLPVMGAARENDAMPPHDVGRVVPALMADGLTTRLKNAHILAVDDQEDARDLLRLILENAGAQVTPRVRPPKCWSCWAARYDALIADLGMPQMDGLELIRRVRQTLPAPANQCPPPRSRPTRDPTIGSVRWPAASRCTSPSR